MTREVRALALLPVRDLAVQVFKVFQTYTEGSDLKVTCNFSQGANSVNPSPAEHEYALSLQTV